MPGPDNKSWQASQTSPERMTSPAGSLPTTDGPDFFRAAVQSLSERYEVLSEVGRGGMGVVYRARDRETDDIIALKALRPELSSDTRLVERFKRELRLARRITHRNVCRVYELHRTPELCFVTMEFVEGESLRSLLHRRGGLNPEEGIAIARQVCAALREAHNQGIVHRDLKPENVMLDRSGVVKVMDFGIARALDTASTFTGGVLGTPAYMAPEQAQGQPVDRRTDVYALGLVLYEIFTGVTAFTADTPLALAWKQVHEMPVHPRDLEPSLPPLLEKAILKCVAKDPSQRYQSLDDLDVALGQVQGTAPLARTTRSGKQPWFANASANQLPRPPRVLPRTLFALVQLLYLSFYLVALIKFGRIHLLLTALLPDGGRPLTGLIGVTALLGIALRLYMLSAVGFDYRGLGDDFRRLSLLLIPLDLLWALSPLLLLAARKLGVEAYACVVALALLPMSQRTLIRMAYHCVQE